MIQIHGVRYFNSRLRIFDYHDTPPAPKKTTTVLDIEFI